MALLKLRGASIGAGITLLAAWGCGSDGSASAADAAPPDAALPDAAFDAEADAGATDQRQTSQGAVRGQQAGDVWVFRGIPFATPPVGELRFRPPEPHPGWPGVREAFEFGEICAQLGTFGALEGSEDCLTLNIWTPAAPGAGLPVMVWIHGGDNVAGSTSDPGFFEGELYDGRNIAERGGVVLVSIQYRLGAFGFLSHPDLASDNPRGATGNWGLMDQIAALEWVQQNIAAFGGDPSNVTVFGQSAGADDTCALVASPRAAGLLHRAISMSPGGCHLNDATVSANVTAAVTTALGCASTDAIACLRGASVDALAHAPQSGAPLHPDRVDFYVELDGWVLTEPPIDVFRAGKQNAVPLIFGTTAEEYAAILAGALPETIPPADYPIWMNELFGPEIGPQAAAIYDPADYGSIHVALIAAHGDAVHHCSVRAVARAAAATQSAPVHTYVYAHTYDDPRLAPYAASHGFDLPLVFGNPVGIALTPSELALGDRVLQAFTRFARTGDPDADATDDWPRYDQSTASSAVIDDPWSTISGFRAAQCDFWDGIWSNI